MIMMYKDDPMADLAIIAFMVLLFILAGFGLYFIITGNTIREHTVYIENGVTTYETYTWEKDNKEETK